MKLLDFKIGALINHQEVLKPLSQHAPPEIWTQMDAFVLFPL